MSYRRRATPLHAAGAAAACTYCLALGIAALLLDNPITLAAVAVAILAAGVAAGVGAQMRRALALALPLALLIVLINALVTRDGLTVIARLGDLPILGQTDVTLEATVYGAVLGLRALALILCGALYTTAVDPDEVLRLFRRVSFRSALTATLATRMVPVLMRDSRRLADAQRCRPGPPPSRFTLVRAASSGVLDRALDVAAALEVRGYGAVRTAPRRRRAFTRHDFAFGAAGLTVLALAVVARATSLAPFTAYPSLHMSTGAGAVGVAVALVAVALAPFLDRRGIVR
jgi:energy-coupling factor transport system permease protein